MGVLRLHAVSIDEVRAIVGADPDLRARLEQIATERFHRAEPSRPIGLLGRLGPLLRRPVDSPVVAEDDPTPADFAALVEGRFLPPERVPASWRLLDELVAGIAWGSVSFDLERRDLDEADFDLARAQCSSDVGLGRLLDHDAALGVRAPQGRRACALPHRTAVAMAAAWQAAMQAEPVQTSPHRDLINEAQLFLGGFPAWAEVAASLGRPAPDLIAFTDLPAR